MCLSELRLGSSALRSGFRIGDSGLKSGVLGLDIRAPSLVCSFQDFQVALQVLQSLLYSSDTKKGLGNMKAPLVCVCVCSRGLNAQRH